MQIEITNQAITPKLAIDAPGIDKAQANTEAIRRTLAKYGRVDLPPGPINIDNDIRVSSGNVIQGLGTPSNPTEIRVLPGSPAIDARSSSASWYSIIQSNTASNDQLLIGPTFGLPVGPAVGVTVRNLVLNAGFDDQIKDVQGRMKTTCQAISIQGTSALIEDVTLKNVAKGFTGGECFPVRIFSPADGPCVEPRPSRINRCKIGHIGQAGNSHTGGGGDEITIFSIVGSKTNTIMRPVIENCEVRDLKRSPTQPSPIQVLHTAYCIGAEIRGNSVLDSDAVGYYQDTGQSRSTRIHDNLFSNIFRGIYLNAATDFQARGLSVDNNTIDIYSTQPDWKVNGPPAAILLQKTSDSSLAFVQSWFTNNRISARLGPFGALAFYSRGLYLELREKSHAQALVFANNIIDVLMPTDDADGHYPPTWPSLLSIYVANMFGWDVDNNCLRAWNNRDSTGFMPKITVTDDKYIPKLAIPQS